MPSNALTVARQVRLWRDENLTPQAASRVLATLARQGRDKLIASGDAPPLFETYVDGRKGASEDTVNPSGAILYRFGLEAQAAIFATSFAITASPKDSGDYAKSWIIAVDRKLWRGDWNDIPPGSEVMIVNFQPYSRKIDVGSMPKMRVPPGIIEMARQATRRKFPTLRVERQFVTLTSALKAGNVEVPYILRGHAHLQRVVQSRRSSAFRAGRIFRAPRLDTVRGSQLTYPALIISTD